MSARRAPLLCLALLAAVVALACCPRALALPAAAGVQAGRAVGAAASVPRAREASLLCPLGTPVIGGTLPKGPCEAAEKLVGKAVGGLVGEAVGAVGGGVMNALAEWMIGAASTVTRFVASEMQKTSTPQLGAAWFEAQFAPMADLGAALGLLVSLIALASAAIRRDPSALAATLAGIVRAAIGTGLVVALSTLGLEIADQISNAILASTPHSFYQTVSHAWGTTGFGGFESSALATLIALVEVLVAIFVLLELIVRDAGLYVAVLFFPVVLAASIWPALSSWTGRLARIQLLLIVLKPVALIVLCLAGSAAAAGLTFSGSLSGSAGTILAAIVIFALAAFAPWVLMYLLAADAEAAHAGLGLRAGAGAALAGSQGRSLRNLGGLRNPSSSSSRAGGGPPGRGGPAGGRGPRGQGGGSPGGPGAPSGGPSADGGTSTGQETLPLDGAAVGAGSLGAAAGHAKRSSAQPGEQPHAELEQPSARTAAPRVPDGEVSPRPAGQARVVSLPARGTRPRPCGDRGRSEVARTPDAQSTPETESER